MSMHLAIFRQLYILYLCPYEHLWAYLLSLMTT